MEEEAVDTALRNPARLAALAEVGLLDEGPTETLDRYVRLARNTLGAPVALVSLVDDHRQFFSSAEGLPEPWASNRETPLTHSFCKHVVADEAALVVADAPAHPKVKDNLAIRDLSVRAYAGMPIRTADGHVLGSFCAIDSEPHSWTDRELAILRDLAAGVSMEMDLRRRLRRAQTSERRVAKANASLLRAHDDSAKDARGAVHDLSTPLSVLNLGLAELRAHEALKTCPELGRLIEIMTRSANHASSLLNSMRGRRALGGDGPAKVEVAALVRQVCEDLASPDGPRLVAAAEGPAEVPLSETELRRCLENLISNAQRFADEQIVVTARPDDDEVEIRVDDDGPGLPSDDAYERVWEVGARFHEGRSRRGLGMSIVREVIGRSGGRVVAEPSDLGGARFVLHVPRVAPSPDSGSTS